LTATNFPAVNCTLNDASSGTNKIHAVITTTIKTTTDAVPVKIVKVECVWNFMNRGNYTNNFIVMRSPDQ
jgi:hypothetical protein